MPAQGMGQMIQMISALAEMQDRRRKIALDEAQFDEQKQQFAKQLGFQEKSQQQAAAFKLIDIASQGGVDGAVALKQLAVSMGLPPDQAESISHVGMDAGAALQRIQARHAEFNLGEQQAGKASLGSIGGNIAPTSQEQVQQAAYMQGQAQTNPGALAGSQFLAQLLKQPLGQDMLPALAQGAHIRTATGGNAQEFNMNQAMQAGGMYPAAASIGAGITPNANTMVNDQTQRGGILAQLQAAQLAAGGRENAQNAEQMNARTALMKAQLDILTSIGKPEFKNEATQSYLWQMYNRNAPMLGLDPIHNDSDVEKARKKIQDQTGLSYGANGMPAKSGPPATWLPFGTTPGGMSPIRP